MARALDFWRNIWTPLAVERFEQYVAEDYIEHFPGLKGGRKELVETWLGPRKAKMPNGQPLIEPFVTIIDGDISFLAMPGVGRVRIEIQRWSEGRQVEHWDGWSINAPPTAPKVSARTPAEQRNLDLVLKFWNDVLTPLRTDLFGDYVATEYIEHDATVPDGGLKAFVDFHNRNRERNPRGLSRSVFTHTLVDGDMVLLTQVKTAPKIAALTPGGLSTDKILGADVFRVRHGKIVEHWSEVYRE